MEQPSTRPSPARPGPARAAAAPVKVAYVGLRGVPAIYGGVDRVIEEVSTGLAERGHHITVYCWKSIYRERPGEYRGIRLMVSIICVKARGFEL